MTLLNNRARLYIRAKRVIDGKLPKGYKKLGKPPSSMAAEMSYLRKLRQYVRDLIEIEKGRLFPQISNLVELANLSRPRTQDMRTDTYSDDFEGVLNDMKVQFYQKYPQSTLNDMAETTFGQIENQNRRYYQRATQSLISIPSLSAEGWLLSERDAFMNTQRKLITKISEEQFSRIEQATLSGLRDGRLATDIAKDLQAQIHIPKNKAKLIARDQTSKLVGNLNQYRQKSLGINQYVWSTAGDNRVRDEHLANEGRIFSWDDPPSTGHPGEDINCRCVAIPIVKA